MANERLARRYATAVFSLAKDAQSVDLVGADLRVLARALVQDDASQRFFLSPVIQRAEKERVLTAAFAKNVHIIALHTVLLLVQKHREALLLEIIRQYELLQLRSRGAEPLLVTTPKALSESALRDIVSRLEKMYHTQFETTQKVDPELIGGLRITLGDRRIDGTVAGRLEELSRELFASA